MNDSAGDFSLICGGLYFLKANMPKAIHGMIRYVHIVLECFR